jgi:hypothetical protein
METLDMDHNLFTSNAGDKSLYVQFYMHFNENQTKSQEAGRPVFDDCEFVKIFSPGDRTNIIDRPVRESDKLRFPGQYAAFKANKEQQASGTPACRVAHREPLHGRRTEVPRLPHGGADR